MPPAPLRGSPAGPRSAPKPGTPDARRPTAKTTHGASGTPSRDVLSPGPTEALCVIDARAEVEADKVLRAVIAGIEARPYRPGHPAHDELKHKSRLPLKEVMRVGAAIAAEDQPLQCLEACVAAMARLRPHHEHFVAAPLRFESFDLRLRAPYRHAVLMVYNRHTQRYGTVGRSRSAGLQSRWPRFRTASALCRAFLRAYARERHIVVRITLGAAVPDPATTAPGSRLVWALRHIPLPCPRALLAVVASPLELSKRGLVGPALPAEALEGATAAACEEGAGGGDSSGATTPAVVVADDQAAPLSPLAPQPEGQATPEGPDTPPATPTTDRGEPRVPEQEQEREAERGAEPAKADPVEALLDHVAFYGIMSPSVSPAPSTPDPSPPPSPGSPPLSPLPTAAPCGALALQWASAVDLTAARLLRLAEERRGGPSSGHHRGRAPKLCEALSPPELSRSVARRSSSSAPITSSLSSKPDVKPLQTHPAKLEAKPEADPRDATVEPRPEPKAECMAMPIPESKVESKDCLGSRSPAVRATSSVAAGSSFFYRMAQEEHRRQKQRSPSLRQSPAKVAIAAERARKALEHSRSPTADLDVLPPSDPPSGARNPVAGSVVTLLPTPPLTPCSDSGRPDTLSLSPVCTPPRGRAAPSCGSVSSLGGPSSSSLSLLAAGSSSDEDPLGTPLRREATQQSPPWEGSSPSPAVRLPFGGAGDPAVDNILALPPALREPTVESEPTAPSPSPVPPPVLDWTAQGPCARFPPKATGAPSNSLPSNSLLRSETSPARRRSCVVAAAAAAALSALVSVERCRRKGLEAQQRFEWAQLWLTVCETVDLECLEGFQL